MKRIHEPIQVTSEQNRPRLLKWRGSVFEVQEILDWWVVQGKWWTIEEERRIYFRVETRSRVLMELYRSGTNWVLGRIQD